MVRYQRPLIFFKELAISRGGLCLSDTYQYGVKLKWQCSEGHQWEAMAGNVLHLKTWCPYCKNNARGNLLSLKEYAAKRGGKCLSEQYINNFTPTQFQCSEGHTWWMMPVMRHKGSWCPECSKGKQRLGIDVARKFAEMHNGKCISEEYHNVKTNMIWECSNGHTFIATFERVRNGQWCRKCKKK